MIVNLYIFFRDLNRDKYILEKKILEKFRKSIKMNSAGGLPFSVESERPKIHVKHFSIKFLTFFTFFCSHDLLNCEL